MNSKYLQILPKEITFKDTIKFESKKYIVDIGCGNGDFLVEFCQKNPDIHYFGIDIVRKKIFQTNERLEKRNLNNYNLIYGDAFYIFQILFPNETIDEIYINFPTPWIRERYWKNRLLRPYMLIQIYRILKPSGILNFITDIYDYAKYASDMIINFNNFKSLYDPVISINRNDGFKTLFFTKMAPLRDIHYLKFMKI